MAAFVARPAFPVLESLTRSYFLGHHRTALSNITQLVSSVELIIECRDYRVPLSSRNPMFEKALIGRERLMVYTKRDLAGATLDKTTMATIRKWHAPHNVMFSDIGNKSDVKKIIDYAKEAARLANNLIGSRMLIVGMPNVGKSSLLNAMRRVGINKGKAAITGGQPGVTRKIATHVKISDEPLVYLIDSPGVFVPYVPNSETMLKLALVGCVKDTIIPPVTLADYMLYQINLHDPTAYAMYSPPTNNVMDLLTATAKKTGRLARGGEPDLDATALWLINRWRNGAYGRNILDPVDEMAYIRWLEEEESAGKSNNQLKKAAKQDMLDAKKARRSAGSQPVA